MEKVFGPFEGYFVAVEVRDLGQAGTSFLGHYKICLQRPLDFAGAEAVRSKCVEGLCASEQEAQDIALKLARLQIRSLRRLSQVAGRIDREQLLANHQPTARSYEPTVPGPLVQLP